MVQAALYFFYFLFLIHKQLCISCCHSWNCNLSTVYFDWFIQQEFVPCARTFGDRYCLVMSTWKMHEFCNLIIYSKLQKLIHQRWKYANEISHQLWSFGLPFFFKRQDTAHHRDFLFIFSFPFSLFNLFIFLLRKNS